MMDWIKTTGDVVKDDITFNNDSDNGTMILHGNGQVFMGTLAKDTTIGDFTFGGGKMIFFNEDGSIRRGTIASNGLIVFFNDKGKVFFFCSNIELLTNTPEKVDWFLNKILDGEKACG